MHRLVGLAFLGLLLTGCGERIRARPEFDQRVLEDGQAARVVQEGLTVTARPVELPERYRKGMAAFEAVVVNRQDRPVRLSYAHVRLLGTEQGSWPALNPQRVAVRMLGPIGAARWAEPGGLAARPRVGVGVGAGTGGGFGGIGVGFPFGHSRADAEPYLRERADVNQFLGRLWDDRVVPPDTIERGIFVFDRRLAVDEPVVVELVVALEALDEPPGPRARYPEGQPTLSFRLGFVRTR